MNRFMQQLDRDIDNCFLNSSEFGEDSETDGENVGIVYRPASGAPERIINGLYDAPDSSAGTEATVDVADNMPHLTLRQSALENGKVSSGDRFVVRGVLLKPVDDNSPEQGIVRIYCHIDGVV